MLIHRLGLSSWCQAAGRECPSRPRVGKGVPRCRQGCRFLTIGTQGDRPDRRIWGRHGARATKADTGRPCVRRSNRACCCRRWFRTVRSHPKPTVLASARSRLPPLPSSRRPSRACRPRPSTRAPRQHSRARLMTPVRRGPSLSLSTGTTAFRPLQASPPAPSRLLADMSMTIRPAHPSIRFRSLSISRTAAATARWQAPRCR